MVIVFGRRAYGRIDAHGGEHAQTTFAHGWYMPIVPSSSFWVTRQTGRTLHGFSIRTSGKSIAAAYLRCWAPIMAFGALVYGSLGGYLVAAVLACASAWAWSWRSLRGVRALRRSDFQLLAFGTRCDPERMRGEMRDNLKRSLDERWAALDAKRSPDEVAEHGAASAREAVIAYGLLRLASIDAPRAARAKAAEAARRILDGTHEALPVGDGPYRVVDPDGTSAAAPILGDIANAASAVSAAKVAQPERVAADPWWHPTRAKWIFAGLFAMACLGGVLDDAPALCGAHELSSVDGAVSRDEFVALRCTSDVVKIGQFSHNEQVYGCTVGGVIVPVLGDVSGQTVLVGKLREMRAGGSYGWPEDMLSSPTVARSYLKVESLAQARAVAVVLIVALTALAGLVFVWLRMFVQRRRRR